MSSLEELNVHLQKENAKFRSLISRNTTPKQTLKGELDDVIKRLSKCEEVISRQDEDSQNKVERATETMVSDDDNEVLTKGHPGPRIGEEKFVFF